MAKCADCVHVDVCEDITRHKLSPERAKELLPILRNSGKICDHFQDRSRRGEGRRCKTVMVKKKKCRACGFKFRLEKENRYLARKSASLVGNLSERPVVFEMFDCPNCGCQNAVGVYEQPIEEE